MSTIINDPLKPKGEDITHCRYVTSSVLSDVHDKSDNIDNIDDGFDFVDVAEKLRTGEADRRNEARPPALNVSEWRLTERAD